MTIEPLFEDNHLLVVIKPSDIPCQADDSGDPDMLTLLKEDIKIRHQKPGNVFLGLVHRLDRPTGGIMVFARTSKAASRLSDQMRKHDIRKTYLAAVQGHPPANGNMVDYLIKDREKNRVSVCEQHTEGARDAELKYETLCNKGASSLVKVALKTGRSHQIRVQFASRGYALLGDKRYNPNPEDTPLGLWAVELSFSHPTTKEAMCFRTSPPADPPWDIFDRSEFDLQ